MSTVSHSRILNPMQNLLRSIDRFQNIQILDADHLFPQQCIADPVQQTLPVFLADQDNRKRLDLARLDEGDRLKQFIQRAESPREDHKGDRVFYEHDFSNEEISEVQKLVRKDVWFLLQGQLDVQANGCATAFGGSSVRGFHHAGASSRDHRVTVLSQQARYRVSAFVRNAAGKRARRPKNGNSGRDLGKHFEAFDEFGDDAKNAPGVLTCKIIDDVLFFDTVSFHKSSLTLKIHSSI